MGRATLFQKRLLLTQEAAKLQFVKSVVGVMIHGVAVEVIVTMTSVLLRAEVAAVVSTDLPLFYAIASMKINSATGTHGFYPCCCCVELR